MQTTNMKNETVRVSQGVVPVPEELSTQSIAGLAEIIRGNWKPKVYFGAVPYLDAMRSMQSINDDYGFDPGREVVNYFLANAQTWRGDVARSVKAELNKRVSS